MKIKKQSSVKFILTIILALVCAVCLTMGVATAYADRTVTMTGSNFFYANNGASLYAYRETETTVTEDDEGEAVETTKTSDYVMFYFQDNDDNVTYRYNLAYHWYEAAEADEDGNIDYNECEEGWFSMEIGFAPFLENDENNNFESYTIMFQSQQYSKTDDEVTTNYITFVRGVEAGRPVVYVVITDDEKDTEKSADTLSASGYTALSILDADGNPSRFSVEFTGCEAGEYSVKVTSGADGESVEGVFANVGGTYSKRVNSTTAGVMPLTFSAVFGDGDTDKVNECGMILFSMNGQSFAYNDASVNSATYLSAPDETVYVGSTVTDDTPPVLCIEGNFSYLEYGKTLDFDYTVIDVLASSPKAEMRYYILSDEQYNDPDVNLNLVEDIVESAEYDGDDEDTEDEPEDEILEASPFVNNADDGMLVVETGYPYLPRDILEANEKALVSKGCGYTVECLVKVCIELTDITSSSGNNATTYVMLDWYVSDDDIVTVHEGEDSEARFIKAISDTMGSTYGYYTQDGSDEKIYDYMGDDESYTYHYYDEEKAAEYQGQIDDLAMKDNECLLFAGSSSNFYLPAYTGFIYDSLDGYEDFTFSVYYSVNGSTNSNTGLAYNELYILLAEEGVYRFTVYATDRFSNTMYYVDEDGEVKDFSGSDVYDDDFLDILPWFTFRVQYNGASVEDAGDQSTAYVGTAYSAEEFEINGLSDYYETEYKLYEFDRVGYMTDFDISIFTYSDAVEMIEELYTSGDTRPYFTEIKEYENLNENDPDYDDFCDYEWDSHSLSFIPQNSDCYYVIKLTVTDTSNHCSDIVKYMVIATSQEADTLPGESQWVQNNVASIVLFSVAGAALIAIIVLLLIRPKDSGDIDEQLAREAEKEKERNEKRAAKRAAKKS